MKEKQQHEGTKEHFVTKNIQSSMRHVKELRTSDTKKDKRSSLVTFQSSVRQPYYTKFQNCQEEMDFKTVKKLHRGNPSEIRKSTRRWKDIYKPGDYRNTRGPGEKITLRSKM